ncbi:GlxA family transcriptional regulator [Oceanospirillum beijerinckii]|uniref:GlxA family transcriptional regulator n=1 Tax=Oceanospirillum beijerinckii TaxID=64976 RepID=UPI000427F411|nr:GlxA family transcriptional regulator [Oceanospirillum beijerinckii]
MNNKNGPIEPSDGIATRPIQVSIALVPGFALTSFSLAIEALSVANELSGQELYRYSICSPDKELNQPVTSSNGVPVSITASMADSQSCDILLLCSYRNAANYNNRSLNHWLKRIHQHKGYIAALSGSAFILAQAGLLKHRSCTLVPEYQATFAELYPDIPIQENLFTVSDHVLTSAGGTATLDMLLYLIGLDHGRDFAWRVAQQFMQDQVRSSEAMQSTRQRISLRIKSPCLGAAVELMEKHIAVPYSIKTLANQIGTTPRNLEMVFRKFADTTPGRYYLQLRLQHAHKMLEETCLSIANIAQATGFNSQSHFSQCFRDFYHKRPSEVRQR